MPQVAGGQVPRGDVTAAQVGAFRVRVQQLDREPGSAADAAVLDVGVQDTGTEGAAWALALRGVDVAATSPDAYAMAWTLRGAPHLHRRGDLPAVAAAVAPWSDADAAKRIYDAAKPLRAAGIPVLTALDEVAAALREVVQEPTVKGEASRQLTERLPAPYLRECRPCGAVHAYEMPFRLSALRAGLELQRGTSPPVLQRITGSGGRTDLDLVRTCLHLLGPATPRLVAGFLEAALPEVQARWPQDTVEVTVQGERRQVLAEDAPLLSAGPVRGARLLGAYDLFLQVRDRALLVPEPDRAKALWPVLGRPGAVLVDGELAGTWRARKSGARLAVTVEAWRPPDAVTAALLREQAERLAALRGLRLAGVTGLD